MTATPPSEPSSSPTEAASGAQGEGDDLGPRTALRIAKGCGCLVACVVLAAGVAFVGKGDVASWGSALVGVLFLVLVVGSSGLTGFWNK